MLAIMSDIHGAFETYRAWKQQVGFSSDDRLFIIGDIFDRNAARPQDCLAILDDVMEHDNIHFLLGNHEFAHLQHYLATKQHNLPYQTQTMWREYLCDPVCGGESLLHHLEQLPESQVARYMSYLSQCSVTVLLEQENQYYYLVHGCPTRYHKKKESILEYIYYVLSNRVDFTSDALDCLKHDPVLTCIDGCRVKDVKAKNLTTIVGHTPTRYLHEEEPSVYTEQPIVTRNRICAIDSGCNGNTVGRHLSHTHWVGQLSVLVL